MPLKPDGDCHDLQARTGRRAKLAPSRRPQPVAKGGHRDKVHRRHPRRQPTATSRLTPPSPRFGYSSIWSSPGYSHCCFTAHSDMDPALVQKITRAFVAIDARDPASKAVLEGEACKAFVPGITTGWETLEKAAEQANIL